MFVLFICILDRNFFIEANPLNLPTSQNNSQLFYALAHCNMHQILDSPIYTVRYCANNIISPCHNKNGLMCLIM